MIYALHLCEGNVVASPQVKIVPNVQRLIYAFPGRARRREIGHCEKCGGCLQTFQFQFAFIGNKMLYLLQNRQLQLSVGSGGGEPFTSSKLTTTRIQD